MSDKANETVWVMGDADINELRGSICTLETLTELMGKFDSNESLEGAQLRDLAELLDREIANVRKAMDRAYPKAQHSWSNADGRRQMETLIESERERKGLSQA